MNNANPYTIITFCNKSKIIGLASLVYFLLCLEQETMQSLENLTHIDKVLHKMSTIKKAFT